jgi:hypothetical protein
VIQLCGLRSGMLEVMVLGSVQRCGEAGAKHWAGTGNGSPGLPWMGTGSPGAALQWLQDWEHLGQKLRLLTQALQEALRLTTGSDWCRKIADRTEAGYSAVSSPGLWPTGCRTAR